MANIIYTNVNRLKKGQIMTYLHYFACYKRVEIEKRILKQYAEVQYVEKITIKM